MALNIEHIQFVRMHLIRLCEVKAFIYLLINSGHIHYARNNNNEDEDLIDELWIVDRLNTRNEQNVILLIPLR